MTDLWQAQGGSQRGRPTRVGMLAVKMQWFERRAPGLTFGTTMTTSSAPIALRAASQKVLAAVRKHRQSTVWRDHSIWAWSGHQRAGFAAWTARLAMRCERGLAYRSPLHARALPNLEGRRPGAMRSVARKWGTVRAP